MKVLHTHAVGQRGRGRGVEGGWRESREGRAGFIAPLRGCGGHAAIWDVTPLPPVVCLSASLRFCLARRPSLWLCFSVSLRFAPRPTPPPLPAQLDDALLAHTRSRTGISWTDALPAHAAHPRRAQTIRHSLPRTSV